MWVDTVRKINRNVKSGKTCQGLKIYVIYLKAHFSNLVYVWVYTRSGHWLGLPSTNLILHYDFSLFVSCNFSLLPSRFINLLPQSLSLFPLVIYSSD